MDTVTEQQLEKKVIDKEGIDKSRPFIKVVFSDINKNNYEQMKQLNNLCLPIRYQEGFYFKILRQNRFGKFGN